MKKLLFYLVLVLMVSNFAVAQSISRPGWGCKTFNVKVGYNNYGIHIETTFEVTICAGCSAYSICGATISKNVGKENDDIYSFRVDDILEKIKGDEKISLIEITDSNQVVENRVAYSVKPGKYNIIRDDDDKNSVIIVDMITK
ncbi:hypothetical protein OX284_003260 [Flavobacterium sp. SUN046]|uniref:hypothetical protein n=1 Tax=Flavobacterium sp. SUN046 TaxID=3002440 RepID=UPI002DB66305|nr:hypothetical protein [Flavobacterium sp. SUN046]MEC4048436.1 hypothetical protein [Flavobacterium sp. SUN046]